MLTTQQLLAIEEYRALRDTIHRRGTARVALALMAIVMWAVLALTLPWTRLAPIGWAPPLLVIAMGFEGVFALHVGVERIGRYLQVYFEPSIAEPPAWEHVAMAFGRATRLKPRIDPLFSWPFLAAIIANALPAMPRHRPVVIAAVGLMHGLAIVRVVMARAYAAKQREADLLTFRQLKSGQLSPPL